jgi:corrinoid protein of di/trimethylamine methyltransferase
MIKMTPAFKSQEQILSELAASVCTLDSEKAVEVSREALSIGIDPYIAISEGLARGMAIMGDRYEKGTCFVPELLIASDAMYAGMDVLQPSLLTSRAEQPPSYRGVIGVMEGDTHDIGKNLVKIMFEAGGFKMLDLGRDVPASRFVEAAISEEADIICVSSLMTTTMLGMGEVVTLLGKRGLRERFKVMVGGACVSASFAQRIGADGYAPNAGAAVKTGKALLEGRIHG